MGMLAKIRRMHLRDGLSIREVSRRTGLSRNTVRQWLCVPHFSTCQLCSLQPGNGRYGNSTSRWENRSRCGPLGWLPLLGMAKVTVSGLPQKRRREE